MACLSPEGFRTSSAFAACPASFVPFFVLACCGRSAGIQCRVILTTDKWRARPPALTIRRSLPRTFAWSSPRPLMNEESFRQEDNKQLIEAVARNEEAAFAALYDRFSDPLYALCLRMTGDPVEAEDILQEAFLTIWRRAPFNDAAQSSVFTWVVHLTRCKVIDHLRARGRRLRVLVFDELVAGDDFAAGEGAIRGEKGLVANRLSTEESTDLREQARRMRRGLEALPADQRQVIEMAFFSDLTHHEISARLVQPLGTVKARIRRGLLKLRRVLKEGR